MKRKATTTGLLLLALLAGLPLTAAQASSLKGSFVEYHLQADAPDHQLAGTLRQEVVEEYGDGRARIRISGEFTDTRFVVERNVSVSQVYFPVLPMLGDSFSFSTARDNASWSITATPLGSEEVNVNAALHRVDVTSFTVDISFIKGSSTVPATVRGTIRTFASGLLYRLSATGESPSHTATLEVTLLDTNLDLNAPAPVAAAGMTSLLASALAGREQGVPIPSSPRTSPATSEPGFLILLPAIGIAAAVAFISLRVRRARRGSEPKAPSERPPHWVRLTLT